MADFNFIVIPELRQCLESDYKELRACLKAEAWKAVHVLAGSIVEAVLIDALGGAGADQARLDSMDLAELITQAQKRGILADEAVDLSTVIRKYRNLIHPGRVKRLEKTVDKSGGIVAAEVVEIITGQVAKRKRETYGYTAEQLFERLNGGSSALPLITYLVNDTPTHEIKRLLIDLLPKAYMDALMDPDSSAEQDRHLLVCYRQLFEASPEEVKADVAKNVYGVYRSEHESTVLIYEKHFFRGSDLAYLSEIERSFIKAHLLPRMSLAALDDLLPNLIGIGPFLDPEEASALSFTLIAAAQREDKNLARRARTSLLNEYSKMAADCRMEVRQAAGFYDDANLVDTLAKREAKIVPVQSTEAAHG
jgi:hypothetical protein